MRFVVRSMRYHIRYWSHFLRVMLSRKFEFKKKNFVVWLSTVKRRSVKNGHWKTEEGGIKKSHFYLDDFMDGPFDGYRDV